MSSGKLFYAWEMMECGMMRKNPVIDIKILVYNILSNNSGEIRLNQ